jgi:hypothetical protein
LLSLSERNLRRFRIIVLEFHHVENWCDPAFFDVVEALFRKLLNHFHVVHIHPNNYGGSVEMGGIHAPRVFEMALLRRDRSLPTGFQKVFPHPLDRPCDPNREEVVLPPAWIGRDPPSKGASTAGAGVDRTARQIFDDIYSQAIWGRNERGDGTSGYGSHDPQIVDPYIACVHGVLGEYGVATVADLGCGDFNVGKQVFTHCRHYVACDVSEVIIKRNRQRFAAGNLEFHCLDLAEDVLPGADLGVLRQVLQHLGNAAIHSFVRRVNMATPYKYLLVTEHVPAGDFTPNLDFGTGGDIRVAIDSGVVLHEAPFHLAHRSRKVLLEIPKDIYGRKALIRTTLYEV